MKADPATKTIGEMVDLLRAQMLRANPEYQRGVVWNRVQQKRLIDSVLRGYPLPLMYLHHIKSSVSGMNNERLEIIDGQQRLQALFDYSEGAFKLFDPLTDAKEAKFPAFVKEQPCPWAGKSFPELSKDLQDKLLSTPLTLAMISSDDTNEVRDIFVRLQNGLPLNAQETRDAWPGDFTDFILKLGGKPQLARYPGHDFFTRTLKMDSASDRGKTRQLAAQITMAFFTRRKNGLIPDINSAAINDFYYENLGFDAGSDDAQRLLNILGRISDLHQPGTLPRLHGHDAIHLVLFVDSLWDDYTPAWQDKLMPALAQFLSKLGEAKLTKDSSQPDPYWLKYGQWTRVNSDRGERIAYRHRFYAEQMLGFMAPNILKDSKRLFGEAERSILFFRQNRKCAVCDSSLDWRDCEIHHVDEHHKGGKTALENGAAVHSACHPKGAQATKDFAEKFEAMRAFEEFGL